jgi:hypothetical protein
MIKKFEASLYNYFDEIIYVDSNPATISSQTTEKVNGELKSQYTRINYDLHSISISTQSNNLFSTECKNSGIIEKIENLCIHKEVDFYPRNLLQRIFGKKSNNLKKELELFDSSYYFITCSKLSKYLPNNSTKSIIDSHIRLNNSVIVAKKSKIIINKNIEEHSDFLIKVEFWIDSDNFIILDLV